MLDKTGFYYFSPTGGTKRAGEILCGGIARDVKRIDLGQRDQAVDQPDSDLVVVAAPVFGGRILAIAAERLRGLDGHGKKAVTLAVYGVRVPGGCLGGFSRTALHRAGSGPGQAG